MSQLNQMLRKQKSKRKTKNSPGLLDVVYTRTTLTADCYKKVKLRRWLKRCLHYDTCTPYACTAYMYAVRVS